METIRLYQEPYLHLSHFCNSIQHLIGKHGNQTLPKAFFDKITSSLITQFITNERKRRDKPGIKMRDVCVCHTKVLGIFRVSENR